MIEKTILAERPKGKLAVAGYEAEKQMAFYLRRAFGESKDVFVFNDLKIERNGEVSQIDHLVLHRFGFAIIESKSITGTVYVNKHGEFVREHGRNRKGMKSPIVQAKMQQDTLSKLLNDHKEQLRRKVLFGIHQARFGDERFAVYVAVADQGEIVRTGIDPPELFKADSIVEAIRDRLRFHQQAGGLGGFAQVMFASKEKSDQLINAHLVPFESDELEKITRFLHSRHIEPSSRQKNDTNTNTTEHGEVAPTVHGEPPPLPSVPTPPPIAKSRPTPPPLPYVVATCRHCESNAVQVRNGRFGYYFKCDHCQGNTAIKPKCDQCGKTAKIQKKLKEFNVVCKECGLTRLFFINTEHGRL